jgi:mono/diheme cytochrome c family protein
VDSLTGIEFVDSVHYFNQFRDVAAKSSEMGLTLYQQRCQFCHGVMRIGAKFGPDFMLPEPISKKFTASSLIKHVSKNPSHSKKKYLAMPKQVSAKPEEIGAIWLWVKMLQDKKVNPYSPRK